MCSARVTCPFRRTTEHNLKRTFRAMVVMVCGLRAAHVPRADSCQTRGRSRAASIPVVARPPPQPARATRIPRRRDSPAGVERVVSVASIAFRVRIEFGSPEFRARAGCGRVRAAGVPVPEAAVHQVSLNCCPSAIYGCAQVTASRNCQPNRSPDSPFEDDTSMQSWRPSGLSRVGLDQPLHPMAVTSLPTSLRRRSGRVPATPGSPISTLRCCRSPAASPLPGRGRCRLTTRSSPIG